MSESELSTVVSGTDECWFQDQASQGRSLILAEVLAFPYRTLRASEANGPEANVTV